MVPFRVRVIFVCLFAFVLVFPVRAQLTVYEDSQLFGNQYANTTNEYGDEVNLAGAARVVTKIQFEYFADFFSNMDEKARLRIYANTGQVWMGNADYLLPSEPPLWESPVFYITPGFHTKTVEVPSIRVPDRFTWTVQFYGLSMQRGITTPDPGITNDVAGLLFYGLAHIGYSFNDFWERLVGPGWSPVYVKGVYKNNFACRVTAIPEIAVPKLDVAQVGTKVRVRWPELLTALGYRLQSRNTQEEPWVNVPLFVERNGDLSEIYFNPTLNPMRFFRLTEPPAPEPMLTFLQETNGTEVQWQAEAGYQVLQTRTATTSWQDVDTPIVPVGNFFSVLVPGNDSTREFRLRETVYAGRLEIIPIGDSLRIRWPGLAVGYALQARAATSEGSWSTIETPNEPAGDYFEATVPVDVAGEGRVFRLIQ